jgi:hypothetical protein
MRIHRCEQDDLRGMAYLETEARLCQGVCLHRRFLAVCLQSDLSLVKIVKLHVVALDIQEDIVIL